MEIDFANRSGRTLNVGRWKKIMRRYMQEMRLGDFTQISVTFVSDPEIQALNLRYREIDAPTDVLSFGFEEDGALSQAHDPTVPRYLGDIVISLDTVATQAAAAGHSPDEELAVLLAHGLLHTLGQDHDTPEKEAAMFARQNELAKLAGGIA